MRREAVRFSALKVIDESPQHYLNRAVSGFKATPVMDFGTLVHCLTFNPQDFSEKFAVFSGAVRRGKVWDKFQEDNYGKIWVKPNEIERAADVVSALRACPLAWDLLGADGTREERLEWEVDGRRCGGTPDLFNDSIVVDLKVTEYGSPKEFPRSARKFLYHAQVAWYENAVQTLYPKLTPRQCYLVTVGPKAPHSVAVYHLTDSTLSLGHAKWKDMLARLIACERADCWPGWSDELIELEIFEDYTQPLTLIVNGKETVI